jgi:hypothetical protein
LQYSLAGAVLVVLVGAVHWNGCTEKKKKRKGGISNQWLYLHGCTVEISPLAQRCNWLPPMSSSVRLSPIIQFDGI